MKNSGRSAKQRIFPTTNSPVVATENPDVSEQIELMQDIQTAR